MSNLTIRFFLALSFVLTLALVFSALEQSISNDILVALMDANSIAINDVMTQFMLDVPLTSNDWAGVSCEDLNKLSGSTIIDFSDKALVAKLELCNSF